VNTIGAFHLGDALTTTPETLRLMIDVNLATALWLSRAVAAPARDPGERGRAAADRHPREPAPVSGAILPAYGADRA